MAAIVVPFSGLSGKQRLEPIGEPERGELALAMLADVLTACVAVGRPVVVAGADAVAAALAAELGATALTDVPAGQGAAVGVALATLAPGAVLVVNADLPCATPRDLLAVLGGLPEDGMALVRAADGTTNVVALSAARLFAPLYGEASARRFREHAARLGADVAVVDVPNLADDVDTPADLERVADRLGPRTRAALEAFSLAAAR
jgi:2-phospho-L-lactate/phosphoenolpyruvate guanylyltransferase